MTQPARADLAVTGARVIDPETHLDHVCNVAVTHGVISHVGDEVPPAELTLNGTGLVLAPGFIDLHSHAQNLCGQRLQALDGVTTALDLEAGTSQTRARYELMAGEGRILNYGYSASWSLARAEVLTGQSFAPAHFPTSFAALQAAELHAGWQRPATAWEIDQILASLEAELAAGALGVGMLLGYLPDTHADEYVRIARLASRLGKGTFTHSRTAARAGPVTAYDAVAEIIDAAAETGAAMHVCHLNSTSDRWLEPIATALADAQAEGLAVTAEAYPYERGSTVIGAPFLTAEGLAAEGREPSSLVYVPTGEHIADATRLEELRREDPGGVVMTLSYDLSDPTEAALMDRAVTVPFAAFASDSIPLTLPGGALLDGAAWPPPDGSFAHPRSAGCFSKVFRWLVRERELLTVPEAVRRCSLLPAQILAPTSPAMARKGRVQVGMDADLVLFDPGTITDRATYTRTRPSRGIFHVVVHGTLVVQDGQLVPTARPGRAVTSDAP